MDDLLLEKFRKNEASPEEMKMVLDWLDQSSDNRKYLDDIDFICNADILYGDVLRTANAERKKRHKFFVTFVRAAAVVILCLGLSYMFSSVMMNRFSDRMLALTVPDGQQISITLEDGTFVWLNSGTTLHYPAVFAGKDRKVRIEGEAMFDVEHNPRHPFIVETYACNVKVLGTKFNISADEEHSEFSVALLEGRLQVVSNSNPSEQTILSPNEKAELAGDGITVRKLTDFDDYRWMDGILNLNGITFSEVMRKFEKYYGVNIEITTDNLPSNRYRGKLNVSDGIDYALHILQLTSDFRYEKDEATNTIYIK